jgi:proline iminopeptidase
MTEFLDVGDSKLRVEIIGEGKPIVFVHGGPGANYLSFKKASYLSKKYKLIFYDQRGSGESSRFENPSPENFSLEMHINDIEEIRKHIGAEKIIILGHSWGGSLVTFYAEKHPDRVEKLIIYSGGPETAEMANEKNDNMMARVPDVSRNKSVKVLEDLGELIESKSNQELVDEKLGEYLDLIACGLEKNPNDPKRELSGKYGFWSAKLTNLYMVGFDRSKLLEKLKNFTAPVLITYGIYEPSPKNRFLDLHDSFPNSKLLMFENSGHQALYEEHDLFMSELNSFIEG